MHIFRGMEFSLCTEQTTTNGCDYIYNNKAVIYAGNYEVLRSDDLYVFDLDTKVHMFK